MSYGFTVTRTAAGLQLGEISEQMLEHIPEGTFTVSGHRYQGPGSAGDALGVHLTGPGGYYMSATAAAPVPTTGAAAG